jgi:hypothetical protein
MGPKLPALWPLSYGAGDGNRTGANAFEINGIEEHATDASRVRRLKCSNVTVRWYSPLSQFARDTSEDRIHHVVWLKPGADL